MKDKRLLEQAIIEKRTLISILFKTQLESFLITSIYILSKKINIMFDQILDLVKEHIANNPEVGNAIPADRKEEVQREVATHVDQGMKQQAVVQGGIGGLLSGLASGGSASSAIQGGIVGTLGNKLGLPPAATGAIAAALPGILQKLAHKANDPNDSSITHETLSKSLGINLGNVF